LRIVSVNSGLARRLRIGEGTVLSAIGKVPLTGAVMVGALALAQHNVLDHAVVHADELPFP